MRRTESRRRRCSRVISSSRVRGLLAAFAVALVAANAASAHGDPSTHMLESENLYPAVASRPSQSLELSLIGVLRAAATKGYPVKIALIANADDLEDTSLLGRPQAYAEYLERELGGVSALNGPLVVIDPSGFGVSGRELKNGRLRSIRQCNGVGSTPRPQRPSPRRRRCPRPYGARRRAASGGRCRTAAPRRRPPGDLCGRGPGPHRRFRDRAPARPGCLVLPARLARLRALVVV